MQQEGRVGVLSGDSGKKDPAYASQHYDVLLARLTNHGHLRWTKQYGGVGHDYASDIAIDQAGHILLTGSFYRQLSLGGALLRSAGETDGFVASFTDDGKHRWSLRFGGLGDDSGDAIASGAGGAIVAGTLEGEAKIGNDTYGSPGKTLVIARLTDEGKYLSSQAISSAAAEEVSAMSITTDGVVALAGFAKEDERDLWLATLTADGQLGHSSSYGGAGDEQANGIAVDSLGNVVLVGSFDGVFELAGVSLTATSGSNGLSVKTHDIFVAKLRL